MLNQAEITTTIKSIPWFLDLSHESINRLNAIADVISLEPGNVIFSEGDQHPCLYVVLKGKVQLESFVPGRGSLPLFTAESLDVVGWSSLTPVVRQMTCTATVLSSTKLLKFNAQALMACCEADCELGFVIMRRLANIVASRLLTHRLHLLEIISCQK
jgi:CRP-like cAMP-binding protein